MAADFNPDDKNAWYFGQLTRDDTNEILGSERDSGVFLVRDSTSIRGDFVLCVKEDTKVSHYIINKINMNGMIRFKIGDQDFPDISSLLRFYKTHILDTTSLIKPAPRERRLAKFDFPGKDPEDLPFKKGEILVILQKDEESWWTAMNSQGQTGQIPVNYTEKYTHEVQRALELKRQIEERSRDQELPQYTNPSGIVNIQNGQRKLPARARVIQARTPNAYDRTALKLQVGDIVEVTRMNVNGNWEGTINNRSGHFPFTHVTFIEDGEQDGDDK